MEWFRKYGDMPIMIILFVIYVCVPFAVMKFVLEIIGSFAIGWIIAKLSFWLRDKIVEK